MKIFIDIHSFFWISLILRKFISWKSQDVYFVFPVFEVQRDHVLGSGHRQAEEERLRRRLRSRWGFSSNNLLWRWSGQMLGTPLGFLGKCYHYLPEFPVCGLSMLINAYQSPTLLHLDTISLPQKLIFDITNSLWSLMGFISFHDHKANWV